MRNTIRHILLPVMLFLSVSSAIGQTPVPKSPPADDEKTVLKLEREWLDAYEQRDAAAMDRIVADGFVITFPDGSMQTRQQLMDDIKRPRSPAAPSNKFFTDGVQASIYGDTIILRGTVITEYQRDGKTVKEYSRYTDTYLKRGGRWQVIASHLSNAPR